MAENEEEEFEVQEESQILHEGAKVKSLSSLPLWEPLWEQPEKFKLLKKTLPDNHDWKK